MASSRHRVTPVEYVGFPLTPLGFFAENPALNLFLTEPCEPRWPEARVVARNEKARRSNVSPDPNRRLPMNRRKLLKAVTVAAASGAISAPAIAQSAPALRWRLATTFPKNLD